MSPLISLVIPAYNEAANIPELAKRLRAVFQKLPQYNFEVIIVENGSSDTTLAKLQVIRRKDKRFKILQLSRNFGCDGGIAAGLSYAKGNASIIMMADLQDPPEMISKFLRQWEKGYEIIYGIVRQRQGTSAIRNLNSQIFYKIMNRLTGGLFPENVSDFRLIDKKVYRAIVNMPEHNKFMRGMVMWAGFTRMGVEFNRPPRFAGESKANLSTVLQVAINGIFSL